MIEVAVIGAGAAGLVASRHLLGYGLRPCIFEVAKTVGGAWSPSSPTTHNENDDKTPTTPAPNDKMWNGLTTNLSKHTCRFSELPWPANTPSFVSSTDMGHYLESYANEFVDQDCFHYNCQVTNIEKAALEEEEESGNYKVEWTDLNTNSKHTKEFGGVVVATGFFTRPHWPKGLLQPPSLESDDNNKKMKLLHSNNYKNCKDFENEVVAVVGSSFSALEIAVDVSRSAKKVINILPSIPWVVPRFIPDGDTILPIDLAFYRRTKDFPQVPEITSLTKEMCKKRHEYLHSIVGRRQEKSKLGIPTDFDSPVKIAISDHYLDLVVGGSIEVVHGRLEGVDCDKGELQIDTASSQSQSKNKVLSDITKVICCTGYESSIHEFMDKSLLNEIDYDGSDTFCPMTTCWEVLHPSLPNFAFCGMHKGSYMGLMEMQGRLAAATMSCKDGAKKEQFKKRLDEALKISQGIRTFQPRAQFPRFDYVGYMDELTTQTQSLQASNDGSSKDEYGFPKYNICKGDMITPAFYQSNDDIAKACQEELEQEVEKGKNGSRIPAIVASAIIGSWKFDRNIIHFSNNKRERVYGTVKYTRSKDLDYILYREDGLYELTPTKTFNVFREYEYVVKEDDGTMDIFFVEGGKRAHLFLSLKFTEKNEKGYWVATSDHLCIKDLYMANFQIKLDGLAATEMIITYRVKGPKKDYESTTMLTQQ